MFFCIRTRSKSDLYFEIGVCPFRLGCFRNSSLLEFFWIFYYSSLWGTLRFFGTWISYDSGVRDSGLLGVGFFGRGLLAQISFQTRVSLDAGLFGRGSLWTRLSVDSGFSRVGSQRDSVFSSRHFFVSTFFWGEATPRQLLLVCDDNPPKSFLCVREK